MTEREVMQRIKEQCAKMPKSDSLHREVWASLANLREAMKRMSS